MTNLVSSWTDKITGIFSVILAVVISTLTLSGVPEKIAPSYGPPIALVIAAGVAYVGVRRFRGNRITRKYYASAVLSRELYGEMIARMSDRGYRTVAGYVRALIREDARKRR